MKVSLVVLASFATALSLPLESRTNNHPDYSNVDWTKIDYSHVDYSKIDWTKVDYSHVDYSKVDWKHVDYSHVDWSKVPIEYHPTNPPKHEPEYPEQCPPPKDNGKYNGDQWKDYKDFPHEFTSYFKLVATPDQVVNATNQYTGGLKDSIGYYQFGLNSQKNVICYKIELYNFRGDYQSPARTATHIHQADKGKSGPPRIAFPNPEGRDVRRSVGCLPGPFVTGVNSAAGTDTGAGFNLIQIEQNPQNFFADVHSSLAVPGAVRGQLA